uniref:Uncharacterized protein n=1 Tax=Chrysemys picta bellii TaxID=8478 RepID=A0A8C3I327_CHRPI
PHMMASPRILSTVLALLSFLLLLVALGSDHWLVATSHLGSLHEGLWKSCQNSVCEQISSASGKGSPAPPGNPPLPPASTIGQVCPWLWEESGGQGVLAVPFAPGLCTMIALAMYTGEFAGAVNAAHSQVTFGWSFGLGWASFPLFLITGGCISELVEPRGIAVGLFPSCPTPEVAASQHQALFIMTLFPVLSYPWAWVVSVQPQLSGSKSEGNP